MGVIATGELGRSGGLGEADVCHGKTMQGRQQEAGDPMEIPPKPTQGSGGMLHGGSGPCFGFWGPRKAPQKAEGRLRHHIPGWDAGVCYRRPPSPGGLWCAEGIGKSPKFIPGLFPFPARLQHPPWALTHGSAERNAQISAWC